MIILDHFYLLETILKSSCLSGVYFIILHFGCDMYIPVMAKSNCHTTEKSEAIALCKEMPVIPVNKKIILGVGGWGGGEAHGIVPPPRKNINLDLSEA
jgi:hypothetical protein